MLNNKKLSLISSCLQHTAYCGVFFVCCLLFVFLTSCGKKGDPTLASYEKPEAPSNLSAIHRESEIILSWEFPKTKEHGIRGFSVLKSSLNDFQVIASVGNTIRSYRDTDFVPGKEYSYKIVTENLRGIKNASVVLSIKPLDPPHPPGKIRFEVNHETLTLTWEQFGESSYYNVYRSIRQGEYTVTPLNIQPLKEASFQDSFDVNRTVYYTVRSLLGSTIRDESLPSEELEVNPALFIPSAPRNLIAIPTSEIIYLLWKEPPETWITGYNIYRETDSRRGYELVGTSQTPAFVDRHEVTSKRNYLVTALGPSKEGPAAEIKDIAYEPPK